MPAGAAIAGVGLFSSYMANQNAKDAAGNQAAASAEQTALQRDQFDWQKARDENQQELGGAWYDWQKGIAGQDDARRYALNDQNFTNAQDYADESMQNAGLTYDELTGNAYDAQGNLVSDAYDSSQQLMDNAQYSDADYLDAEGQASADVTQAFDKAQGMTRRNLMAYGIDPNSSQFINSQAGGGLAQAGAEVNAINSGRRSMRDTERNRVRDAITTGHGMRSNATTAGTGMVNSAVLAGRSAIGGAVANGRGAIGDALKTNMSTRSEQLGLIDPRIGMPSTAGNVLGQMANTQGQNANNWGAQAAASNQAASNALAAGIGGAAQIYGYNQARPPYEPNSTPPQDY